MTDRQAGDFAEIRSVGRALDLLEIMQRAAPAGIRVCDAATTLGIDPATASRLMATLMTRGYASRMPNRRYTLGARSLRLASGWIDRLLQVADAPMRRIADGCGETVYLLQLVGRRYVHRPRGRPFGDNRRTIRLSYSKLIRGGSPDTHRCGTHHSDRVIVDNFVGQSIRGEHHAQRLLDGHVARDRPHQRAAVR